MCNSLRNIGKKNISLSFKLFKGISTLLVSQSQGRVLKIQNALSSLKIWHTPLSKQASLDQVLAKSAATTFFLSFCIAFIPSDCSIHVSAPVKKKCSSMASLKKKKDWTVARMNSVWKEHGEIRRWLIQQLMEKQSLQYIRSLSFFFLLFAWCQYLLDSSVTKMCSDLE